MVLMNRGEGPIALEFIYAKPLGGWISIRLKRRSIRGGLLRQGFYLSLKKKVRMIFGALDAKLMRSSSMSSTSECHQDGNLAPRNDDDDGESKTRCRMLIDLPPPPRGSSMVNVRSQMFQLGRGRQFLATVTNR